MTFFACVFLFSQKKNPEKCFHCKVKLLFSSVFHCKISIIAKPAVFFESDGS